MRVFAFLAAIAIACVVQAAESDAPVGARYSVQVRQGADAPWKDQGVWVLGGRADERPIEIRLGSGNGGQDVVGQVKYAQKEGMLGVKLRRVEGRRYTAATKAGTADHVGEGHWVIGRAKQTVKQLVADSTDGGVTLTGKITYADGEPAEFRARVADLRYQVQIRQQPTTTQPGEQPWQDRGVWVLAMPTGDRPISMHFIARGQGAGGKVQFEHDKGSADILLDPVDGKLLKAVSMTPKGEKLELGDWVLDDKKIFQLYATSTDEGKTLVGYIIYTDNNTKKFDFKANFVDALPDDQSPQAKDDANNSATPAASTYDGQYTHEGTVLQVSGNGSKLLITAGDSKIEGEIASTGKTFKGFVYLNGATGDKVPVTGTYASDSVSLSIAGGEPIVHKAARRASTTKPAE